MPTPATTPVVLRRDIAGCVIRLCERGYGFIRPDGGDRGDDIYFHRSALRGGLVFDHLPHALPVVFDKARGERGPVAVNIRPAKE